MKKLLLILSVAVGGYLLWRRIEDRDERDLWAEVTDTFE
ncbi:DLW-39 family protein [Cellulomonas fimi]|nr:DLW-39 family protein [Cellulomonas fimi]